MPISDEERIKQLEDSHDHLEIGQIKMESAITSMSSKVSDMAGAITTMSGAVSKYTGLDNKIDIVAKDVAGLAETTRQDIRDLYGKAGKVNERIAAMSEDHYSNCDLKCEQLDDKADKRGSKRLTLGLAIALGAVGAVASYFYLDMNVIAKEMDEGRILYTEKLGSISEGIHKNHLLLRDTQSRIDLLSNDIDHFKTDIGKLHNEE